MGRADDEQNPKFVLGHDSLPAPATSISDDVADAKPHYLPKLVSARAMADSEGGYATSSSTDGLGSMEHVSVEGRVDRVYNAQLDPATLGQLRVLTVEFSKS